MYQRAIIATTLFVLMAPAGAHAESQADAELNRLYQKIESKLSANPAAKHQFTVAQRAWIAFRDAECKFAASGVEGGSVYPQVYGACIEDLTEARVANFNTYLSCEEGDLACPVPAN